MRLSLLSRVTSVRVLFAGIALASASLGAATAKWKPVPAEELAETAPRLEAKAPAEVVFSDLDIDDSDFPRERRMTVYVRFKIYEPGRAESLTRNLVLEMSDASRRPELVARLTLPNGRTQDFGREAMKEQTVVKRGGTPGLLEWLLGPAPELRERFLAISGVEAGAVLDYRITWTEIEPEWVHTIQPQSVGVPIRRFTFTCRMAEDPEWLNRTFGFNLKGAQFQRDPARQRVTLNVANLPTLQPEPFRGPPTDYALTIKSCYERVNRFFVQRDGGKSAPIVVDPKLGPWSTHATFLDRFSADRTRLTARVRKLASEITAEARDDEAKARAIHRYVTIMSQKYRRRPGPHPKATEPATSLDDVLAIDAKPEIKRPPEEFLWLAMALYRAAGLECHAVMLPDRTQVRFDQREVGRVFLPDRAVAVRLGQDWRFSCPQNSYALPFGLLPWENEGQVALLGVERRAEFIPVPPLPPTASVVATAGDFTLDDDGTLRGEVKRTLNGHAAVSLRGRLRSANTQQKRAAVVAASLGLDPKVVTVTVGKSTGIEDAELPLAIACTLRWPGYATRTKDRLILRGAVLQAQDATPFPASERRSPVQFPFCWQDVDRMTIRVPAGFEPDQPTELPSITGEALRYRMQVAFDRAQNALRVEREFTSAVLDVAPAEYLKLKACYEHVARGDQHEIVFVRRSAAAPAAGGN